MATACAWSCNTLPPLHTRAHHAACHLAIPRNHSTAPTRSGASLASGARRSTHSYILTCLPFSVAKTHPSVVRRTCGVGTPAAQAASWKAVAERTSSSPDWWNGTFTAQLPSAVSSRHTSPCFPRATGPSESIAGPPRPKRRARSTASTTPPHHRCAPHARTDASQIRPCTDDLRPDRVGNSRSAQFRRPTIPAQVFGEARPVVACRPRRLSCLVDHEARAAP
jgi:hypothetical protein